MKNILKICKNELWTIFHDGGTMLVMLIGVVLYSLFYSIPFTTQILRDVPIGVIDNDNSSLSRELIRNFDSSENLKVTHRLSDVNEAKDLFFADKIRAYVIIPKDFERDIFRGQKSIIASFEDSSYLIVYKQVAGGVITTASSLAAKLEIGKFMKKGLSKQQAMRVKLPFEFVQVPLFNPAGGYENYIYPLVLVLILQQTMLVGVGLLGGTLREQLRGVKRKNKLGEVIDVKQSKFCDFSEKAHEIVLGKSLAYVSLYLCHSVFYFLVFPAVFVYHMSYNFWLLAMLLIPYLFAVSFLAQALIYFYTERENSLLMLVVTSLPLIFLPGFVWPKEAIPPVIAMFSKLIPATPAIDGLTRVNQMGAEFYQVQGDLFLILALCLVYFIIAVSVVKGLCRAD